MGRQVDLDDITDTAGVAGLLGLNPETGRNIVAEYRRTYPDFPKPVKVLNSGQCLVWLRTDIEAWMRARGRDAGGG